jgi:hypothetical protein
LNRRTVLPANGPGAERGQGSPPINATTTPICSKQSVPARGVGAALALPYAGTDMMQLHLDEISRNVPRALMRLLLDRAGCGIPPASSTCPPISRRSSCPRAPRSSTRSRTSGSISARTGSQTPSSKTTTPSSTPLATHGESSPQSQTESHPSECATGLTSVSRHDLWYNT